MTARPAAPAAPAAGRAPAARPRRRRLGLVALLAVFAVAAVVAAGVALHRSPGQREWVTVFDGTGAAAVAGSGAGTVVTLRPAVTASQGVTHAGLVVSAASYRNLSITATVQTVRQLRQGASGRANPWEVGWVLWHYRGNQRFYALTLEARGWVLSKQDPAYRGGERFLASGRTPGFAVGVPHHVQITQAGNRITVRADGHLLTRFTDTQRPYLTGAVGLYSEDSVARFSAIHITPLPAAGQRS